MQRNYARGYDPEIKSADITSESSFEGFRKQRRLLIAGGASAVGLGIAAASRLSSYFTSPDTVHAQTLTSTPGKFNTSENQTPYAKATSFNNYYEFGTDKSDPAKHAGTLKTRPWTVQVTGMVKTQKTLDIDTILKHRPLESRIYRHRCVEAWSMVIPWDGYSLSEFINLCEPLPSAKFVQFVTLVDKKQMPDLPFGYDWPYSEGLRLDEAMNPLALLTFGCYGKVLPNQNGAPIRVVMPWKYGFKNAKSIVRFHFTDKQPHTTWNEINSSEYGFYSNVNPKVDHPRWTQARERRIDNSLLPHYIPTQMFNGYADQVAGLYNGMDLKRYY
ncbi:MAG: protein-methionine-sulfoxide reductase catalytic subunit MsrP [Edaphobacter sp.]|uniref:protein-methionine-sulfoxide reductase catalytic subunit MsrP n=1 Tax=Edaphobacter sp. TaxID=1934404 RepID=UPI0023844381|nr:protein-methionine-sulfoxide reductase catalytic subunit MsrP [Edaphobacter sp.]MDE1175214.1 protein-methionine-sulfoxide reductase catalytic subunit MsrP [Edaphobacter sp.]